MNFSKLYILAHFGNFYSFLKQFKKEKTKQNKKQNPEQIDVLSVCRYEWFMEEKAALYILSDAALLTYFLNQFHGTKSTRFQN